MNREVLRWLLAAAAVWPIGSTSTAMEPAKPRAFVAHFADGSRAEVAVLELNVVVQTRHGKLTVPFAEIRQIEVGFRSPEGMAKKLKDAVANLAAGDFRLREKAQQELEAAGEYSVPLVKQLLATSTQPEARRRGELILKNLETKLSKDQLNRPTTDRIETFESSFCGRIVEVRWKATSQALGEINLDLGSLRLLRRVERGRLISPTPSDR